MGRKIAKNHGVTPLLTGEIFPPRTVMSILIKNHFNHSKTELFQLHFHILSLSRQFEIGPKLVENHGLTLLLFGEIFLPRKFDRISA